MRAISIPHRVPSPRILVVALAMVFGPNLPVWALPDGEQVVAGGVSVARPDGNNMLIQQSTAKAIVNWNGFSIGAAERVQIQQPTASSVILNRVTGASRSDINGTLSANGKVFLVNPNGVVFGDTAAVNVGSLVASTLDVSNADFLADRHHFRTTGAGPAKAVRNAGRISAADHGTVALMGGTVRNDGSVTARLGTVAMGAGDEMTLDLAGDGLSKLTVSRGALEALVDSGGAIMADGGEIVLTARAVGELAGKVVNQTGVLRARALAERGGRIILDGGDSGLIQVAGTIDASAPQAGQRGGEVQVLGHHVALVGAASVDASGQSGGGTVLVGGDYQGRNPAVRNAKATYVGAGTDLRADAVDQGDGGKVVVWSDAATRAHGSISARGGARGGNGGLIETSGAFLDVAGARVSAGAGAGRPGEWLLDPTDIQIVSAETELSTTVDPDLVGEVLSFEAVNSPARVVDADISAALNAGTNVVVRTGDANAEGESGDLTMTTDASIRYGRAARVSLTLAAHRDIHFEADSQIVPEAEAAGALDIYVNARSQADSDAGAVSFQNTIIVTNGGQLRVSGGSVPETGFARGRSGEGPIHAVRIDGSTIATGAGDIEIRGEGRDGADGVLILSSALSGNNIRITGVAAPADPGPEPSFFAGYGGYYSEQTTIAAAGTLDLRGLGQDGAGVHLAGGSSLSSGTGVLRVTGYSSSEEMEGLLVESAVIGGAAQSADMVLHAGRANGLDSIRFDSGAAVRTDGTLVLAPAGLTADGASVTALDTVPIRIGSSESGGFELDSIDLEAISTAPRAVVIGTDTHTGYIEVRDRVIPSFNLALQNEGLGSEGIGLADGIALPGRTLALASAGPITSGGSILAEELFVRGTPSHAVTLTDPANSVNRLAVDPPASFSFVNSGPLVIGPIERASFSSTTGVAELITDPVSSSQGDFLVRTLDGALTLTQPIATLDPGSNITLVSESTFSNIGGSLVPGAGGRWRVWADTWVGEQRGDLTPSADSPNFYGCSYDSGVCAGSANLPADGNRFLYADRPSLTVIADDKSRTYGALNPDFTFRRPPSGLVNGDTVEDALSGTLGSAATQGSQVGGYAIDNTSGGLVSPVGYLISVVPGTLQIERARLLYVANPATRRVGAANPPFSGTVTGFVLGETLETATDGPLVFSTEAGVNAPPGRYAIDGSGLSAANYYFEQAPGNATALAVTPVSTGNEENSILRTIDESSYIYDRNFGLPPMCFATGPLSGALRTQGGDLLALEWSRVRSRPNLSNCVEVDERNACADF